MPVGPQHLWAEAAMKSAPSVVTSTGMLGTDWQASSSSTAPTWSPRTSSQRQVPFLNCFLRSLDLFWGPAHPAPLQHATCVLTCKACARPL